MPMNEKILPRTPPAESTEAPGVYADLARLVRLRAKASGFSFLPRQPIHSILAGGHASRLRGRGLNFEEIRRYFPGDDIRQMDWKVTARTRVPHCRVFNEERGRRTLIVLDQRLSMFFGSRVDFKSVTAADTAALAAWRVIGVKDTVKAVIFGDVDLEVIPAGGTANQVMCLLGAIVRHNQALSLDAGIKPGPRMLNAALRRAEQLAPHDTLVFLITDGTGHDEETRRLLSRIASHNDVLIALVNDPLELNLPSAGSRVFGSGDLQLETDTGSSSLRRAFREDFAKQTEEVRHFLIQREVPLMSITTELPVDQQFRSILGKRNGR